MFLILSRIRKSELFKDSFWAFSGNVVGKGLSLIASICIARLIGKDDFGMYTLIRTSLLSIAVFSTFGLGYTATKFVAEYLKDQPNKVRAVIKNTMQITLIMGGVFTALLFIFCKEIAAFLEVPNLYRSIRYLAIIVFFNSIITTQTGILAGLKRFKALARINFINGLIMFFSSIIMTYYMGLDGALIALLVSTAINCVQNYAESRNSLNKISLNGNQIGYNIKKELVSFSLPIALQEMVYSILSWTLPILLLKYSNIGEVGIYNAAQQWASVILFIPGTLRNVILAHVSSDSDNHSRQIQILHKMLLVNFAATFIPFLLVYLFSGLVVKLYGESFTSLRTVLNISVFTTIFSCLSNVFKQYFMAINRAWITLWFRFGNSILIFVLFVLLVRNSNGENASLHMAQAAVLVQVTTFITLYYMFRRYKRKEEEYGH